MEDLEDLTISEGMPGSPEERRSKIPDVPPGTIAGGQDTDIAQGSPAPVPGSYEQQTGIAPGMQVTGSDGNSVGRVKELLDSGFRVDVTLRPDLTIPYSAIGQVDGDAVILDVPADRAGDFPRTSG